MKVICDRTALLDAINVVSSAVAARSPRPQLMCVKLSAAKEEEAGRLTMTATDSEVWLRLSTSSVDVQEAGEALVPAQKVQQIIAAEDNEPTLTIQRTDDQIEVRGADARFTVYGYPPADFPAAPEFPGADDPNTLGVFQMNAGDLENLIARTLFATARETSRYAINGVLLVVRGKKVEMVATDGRRLALAKGSATGGPTDHDIRCIVPSKALSLVSKLIDSPDDVVRIAVTESQVMFAFGEPDEAPRALLASSVVEGAFPPYEDVIPKDQDKKATFAVSTLRSGVRRAALLTTEDSRGVRMAFGADAEGAKRLRLTSRAPEMGEAEIDVAIDSFEGDDIEIGFNPGFITDALKVAPDEQVVIELKAPNKPGIIKAGADFLYVIMPVNLQ